MARNLILFKGGCPNLSDTVYIYATSPTNYANKVARYLEGNSQMISADTYQISNNMLTLEDKSDYDGITYIIETDPNDTDYIRCYFVNDVIKRSGLMIFTLSLDTFGTYISKMKYQYFNCVRSNVALSNSHIEVGSVVPGQQEITPIKSTTYDQWSSQLEVVLYVTIKRNDTFASPTITTIPIAFTMAGLKHAFDDTVGKPYTDGGSLPQILNDVLGSITKLIGSSTTENYNITLNNAYLIPSEFLLSIGNMTDNIFLLQSKPSVGTLNITAVELQTLKHTIELDIPTTLSKLKKHYLGAYLSNAEINLYTGSTMKVNINTSVSKGAMQIEMNYGNVTKDLTNAFAIVFNNNNIQAESLTRMSNYLGLIASGATAVGGAMSGNPSAFMSGAKSFENKLTGTLNSYLQKPPKNNTVTSADINYLWSDATNVDNRPLTYPIVIVSYTNEDDTAMMANLYGMPCSEVTTNINSIIYGSLIFPNDNINYTFVQGQFSNMKGIPQTAISVIQSAFNSGVKILR
jgi:hypothetical protein